MSCHSSEGMRKTEDKSAPIEEDGYGDEDEDRDSGGGVVKDPG